MTAVPPRPRILSGVQPTGRLHLGNYFGAIRQHVAMQDEGECFYFIADYHALTTIRDPELLDRHVRDVALTYLASGLDPDKAVFYRQSDVPEVCEITWLLETVTGMGLLERAHSYKEKVARGITPSVGLFTYPALMAADILAPRADLVPVGQDQDQHVEMTRDMAQLFNNAFAKDGEPVFALPRAKLSPAARVPGTTFDKGGVVQVTTTVDARRADDGRPLDIDEYAAAIRSAILELLAADPELRSTEELERRLAERHARDLAAVRVLDRTLRVAAEHPGDTIVVTPRERSVGLEFCVPVDRTLFLTRDGRRVAAKMSKSYGNTIEIFDAGPTLKKKVMGIETRLVELSEPLDADEDLVFQLYSLFASPDELAAMRDHYARGGYGFGNAKKALLAKIDEHFAPIRERRSELEREPGRIDDVLAAGAARARAIACETVDRARAACGLGKLRR